MSASGVAHPNITCDGHRCRTLSVPVLAGVRFKCAVCFDTDFCIRCEPSHDALHPRLMYRLPRLQSEPPDWTMLRQQAGPSRRDVNPESTASMNQPSANSQSRNVVADNGVRRPNDEKGTIDSQRLQSLAAQEKTVLNSIAKSFVPRLQNRGSVPDNYSPGAVNSTAVELLGDVLSMAGMSADIIEHGVLRRNGITGAVIYGPQGTGKTALAHALARKHGYNLISVLSGHTLTKSWNKGEEAVGVTFEVARELHPCLIVVDKAETFFPKQPRLDQKEAVSTEFLRQWDLLGKESRNRDPFILLISQAPWDIDPSALCRAPVRVPIDLPTMEERENLLETLLRNDRLGNDISYSDIALATESYSRSDLKSLCAAAATRSLQVWSRHGGERVLSKRHFDFARRCVPPTGIDPDMTRKFAEFSGFVGSINSGAGRS